MDGTKNRIKESVGLYNQHNKLKNNDKMTQKELAELVFQDKDISDEAKHQLMSACIAETRKMSFSEIRRMKKVLGVDANFLLGI